MADDIQSILMCRSCAMASKLGAENLKEMIMSETAQAIVRIDQFLRGRKFDADICKTIGVRTGTVGQQLNIEA